MRQSAEIPGPARSMICGGKRNILGVGVDVIDYEASVESILLAAHTKKPFAVTALAVHGLMTGAIDAEHRFRLNSLDLVVPDGQPVRWALNWLYKAELKDRVYGPDLALKVCKAAEQERLAVYLFGATDAILDRMCENLLGRFPHLQIVGSCSSKFRPLTVVERDCLAAEIRKSGASIVFVGLGCPRQEIWVYEFRDLIAGPVVAVGAAFPFLAGTVQQAPAWMQKRGLEWLFRLSREPLRLWKRYVFLNPYFLWLLMLQRLGLASFSDTGKRPQGSVLPG